MTTDALLWVGLDERDGLFNGESKWRVDRQGGEVMVCRDWYEEGRLVSPQHLTYGGFGHDGLREVVWENHSEGAGRLPYIHIADFANALRNGEV